MRSILLMGLIVQFVFFFLFGCSPKTENESFEGVDVISGAASVIGDESDDVTVLRAVQYWMSPWTTGNWLNDFVDYSGPKGGEDYVYIFSPMSAHGTVIYHFPEDD